MRSSLRPSLLLALTLIACFALIAPPPSHAQWEWPPEYPFLEVLDPQLGRWSTERGTIESAFIEVEPKGIYAQVHIELTLSARGTYFGQGDTLEAALYFELPEEAAFTDSWLWFKGDILRAEIMDGWTARETYENIVRRNLDPSILYKRGGGRYELRVFPMEATEQRRLRLSYLVPVDWTAASISVPLPTALLNASASPVRFEVQAMGLTPQEDGVRLVERPDAATIIVGSGSASAKTSFLVEAGAVPEDPMTLRWDAPEAGDGVFYSLAQRGAETWYQVAALPSAALGQVGGRSAVFVLEYERLPGGIQDVRVEDVLDRLGAQLRADLTPADSFAVVVSGAVEGSDPPATWRSADSASIGAALAEATSALRGSHSDMPSALRSGIQTLGQRGGTVVLISTARPPADAPADSILLGALRQEFGALPPVHAINLDAAQTPAPTGRRWTSFYEALAQATGGSTSAADRPSELDEALDAILAAFPSPSGRFDLYTTRQGGLCYDRKTLGQRGGLQRGASAILQVGQCFGEGAFVAEVSGVVGGVPASQRLTLGAPTLPADSTLIALWTSARIAELEAGGEQPDLVAAALDYSLRERVLSKYTAFLALEPGLGGEVCSVCAAQDRGPIAIGSEDPEAAVEASLSAYPNPFAQEVTLRIVLPESAPGEVAEVAVYDVLGRLVRTFEIAATPPEAAEIRWDGRDGSGAEMASGSYIVVVTTPHARLTATVTLLR